MKTGNQMSTTNQLNIFLVIFSIILGVIACIISNLIYKPLSLFLWSPLAVGIHFLIFSIIFVLGILIFNIINGNMAYHTAKHHDGGKIALCLVGSILAIFILSTLFEFIYELNPPAKLRTYSDPTSYIFIIDMSGSMSTTDPEGERYEAVKKIMAQKPDDFPYAVYSFDDELYLEREFLPNGAKEYEYENRIGGGTAIRKSLEILLSDYNAGKIGNLGNSPKFLLLSDGEPTDVDAYSSRGMAAFNKLLAQYAKTPITISTVGLSDMVNDDFMQNIADATGGVYINVTDVDQLEQSMSTAITQISELRYGRTLFTYRIVPSLGILYGIMRILFLAILAFLISATALFSTGKGDDSTLILVSSIVTGILAGFIVEIGINVVAFSPFIMKIIYFICAAMTFITIYGIAGRGDGRTYETNMGDFSNHGRLKMGQTRGIGTGSGRNASNNFGNGSMTHSAGGDFFSDDDYASASSSTHDSFSDFDDMSSSSGSGSFDSFDDFNF